MEFIRERREGSPARHFGLPAFCVARLQFELEPRRPLHLPLPERGNVLRGAFGTVFQRAVCAPDCPGTEHCIKRESCAYAMLFEPKWRFADGNRGADDAPRGFLFRPTQDPDPGFGPGQSLHFELRLFGMAIEVYPFFLNTFQSLALQGLHGVPARLVSVRSLDWAGNVCTELMKDGKVLGGRPAALRLDDIPMPPAPAGEFCVQYITPTWLRYEKQDEQVPTLPALLCRVRDRLSFLAQLYGGQIWDADFGLIGELAREGRTLAARGAWTAKRRRSSRTGQVMPLAGFVGEVIYDALRPELWPLLVLGQEIHVGRHAVWGDGGYQVLCMDKTPSARKGGEL
jgi:hypothetical protein